MTTVKQYQTFVPTFSGTVKRCLRVTKVSIIQINKKASIFKNFIFLHFFVHLSIGIENHFNANLNK